MGDKNTRPYVVVLLGEKRVPIMDVVSCEITNYQSSEGGAKTAGTIILDNSENEYSPDADETYRPNLEVKIFYGFGKDTFHRFTLYVDSKGFQNEQTGHNEKICTVKLVDLSEILDDEKRQAEWNTASTFVNCKIADSENPDRSIVHILAKRAGINPDGVECCELPYSLPYVNLTKSVWKELCELATAYDAKLECGIDKPLSILESRYDSCEKDDTSGWTLTKDDITHYRRYDSYENYANDIRLKYTRYVKGERQVLWKYSEPPYWYDSSESLCYPFVDDTREILSSKSYAAEYTAVNSDGNPRTVVYAEDLDDEQTFLCNMKVGGTEKLKILKYDTKTNKQKAYIRLDRDGKNITVYEMAISGVPILCEPNFCVYTKDEAQIKKYGIQSTNLTNRYLSDDEYDGKPIYRHFAETKLAEMTQLKNSYFVKTNYALVSARVGSCIGLNLTTAKKMKIEEINFRYKKNDAFETCLWLKEA